MAFVGVLDSGVGGIGVLAELVRLRPGAYVYVADTAHNPYGARSEAEIRDLTLGIAAYLRAAGAEGVVVACNTATAAGIDALRERYADIPVVGMEPAIKPASLATVAGDIVVLATPSTLRSERLDGLITRYAGDIGVRRVEAPGLVAEIERGAAVGTVAREIVTRALDGPIGSGADTVVLGCTHFTWIAATVRALYPAVTVLDPAPAVARRALAVLPDAGAAHGVVLGVTAAGTAEVVRGLVPDLAFDVRPLAWRSGRLDDAGGAGH